MTYQQTHPWIKFELNTHKFPARLWISLGEARSKCEHLAGVPLKPAIAKQVHQVYLAKGVHATAAIEGNTLNEAQVLDRIEGKGTLPKSQEYLGKEIDNILKAANGILAQIEKKGPSPITLSEIKEYNRVALSSLELDDHIVPGEFRHIDVGVMDYKGAPWQECNDLMEKLCEWLNSQSFKYENDDAIIFGIIKSIVSHVYIAWIHPFGDGNGRTARLLEVRFLMEAGVPSAAIHLLSNHYNKTRSEYYRKLSETSKSGGDLTSFFQYAVNGFVDLLREQLRIVKFQQWGIAWESYVYEIFRNKSTATPRRQQKLILALGDKGIIVPRAELRRLTPEIAELYANKTTKTLSRDLNVLKEQKLITISVQGVRANKEIILAFLPRAKLGDVESKLKEAGLLTAEGGQLPLPV
jgi:Fic family protein